MGSLDYQWLDTGNMARNTTVRKLTAGWMQPLASRLRGGLHLAYLDLTQPDNPLAAGQVTTGWGLGLSLDGLLLDGKRVQLLARLSFDYQSTRGETRDPAGNLQISDISWGQTVGALDLVIRPTASLDILGGAEYVAIHGTQGNRGPVNTTWTFRNDLSAGYYGGLRLNLGVSGAIRITGYGGGRTGGRLTFSRQF
ncbi:MAG TPA: hypothetical protein EYP40_01910 [Chromatiales bacterium]|nr:hypothetical protein [Chromatiales bacterium]